MTKLLYVRCSPRGETSKSTQIARAFLPAYREAYPGATIEEMDLFAAGLPEYAGAGAEAKISHCGEGRMEGEVQRAWDTIVRIFEHFNSFDDYVFSMPMWNFGVPYKLKQYIDIRTQPGLLFDFDPPIGYIGLLKNKRVTVIYSAAIYYDGASKAYGTDHVRTHLTDWLEFAGVTDIRNIFYQKYKMVRPEEAEAMLETCKQEARDAARR